MKKHFMCTHAFFDDDAKQAFEDASIDMTELQIFEMMKGKKRKRWVIGAEMTTFSFAIGMQKMRTLLLITWTMLGSIR